MRMLNILLMCVLLAGLYSCKDQAKNGSVMNKASETLDYENTRVLESDLARQVKSDKGVDYDYHKDMSKMYSDLEMTNQQISDYKSLTKKKREKLDAAQDYVTADQQAILVDKDSSLRAVLTPKQYKKYQGMVKKRNDTQK
ncbi:hypothetical protein ACFFU9_13955 [Mariniflexile ostreae]|uniref:Lipoprotein n=1 Tax=Mariniflexile ostreae TaxID=1520892 RepID=A0ABV5FEI7_9FLAO